MSTIYQLFCDNCSWKQINETIDFPLPELKTVNIQKNIPYIDPATNKVVDSKNMKRKKSYKCPRCGRILYPRKIKNAQEEVDKTMEMQQRIHKRLLNDAIEREKQIERQQKTKNWNQ
jgi:DNA-directed RNA polymerase subunit RPC12/RpoP